MFDFSKPCQGMGDELVFELIPIVHVMGSGRQTTRNLWELRVISTDGIEKYRACGWGRMVAHVEALFPFSSIKWAHVDIASMHSLEEGDTSDCVYFIEAVGSGRVKIGIASTSLKGRMSGIACHSPFPLNVLLTIPGGGKEERELHKRFAHLRVHREWFLLQGELLDYIESGGM